MIALEGLAAPFNVWTWHDDYQGYSAFAPGSFSELIPHGLIRLNVHHQQHRTIARQDDGTLDVWESPEGVMFRADLEESPLTRFVADAIAHGFAANVCPCVVSNGTYLETAPGEPRRILQHSVLGCDLAILLAAKGHFPQTWVTVTDDGLRQIA